MQNKRITVLRGGPSEEYEVSMRSGAEILQSLTRQSHSVRDIVITKSGEWLDAGVVRSPEQVINSADVVFLGLHGRYGEDGEIQKLIQRHKIPFTGSNSLPSAVAFNKHLTKEVLRPQELRMPEHVLVSRNSAEDIVSTVAAIHVSFGPEYIIKPVASGSSLGIVLVREGQSLLANLEQALTKSEQVLVEHYIRGKEATCATLENFRNEAVYVFPAIEIIPPPSADFFSSDVKYTGETREICPGNFSYKERSKLAEQAALVHTALGLTQYSRSDFMVKDGEVYFLEVNTLPGLTKESLYPKAAAAVGMSFDQLTEFLVATATY
jgi:D-alanine-D-alanine ligase